MRYTVSTVGMVLTGILTCITLTATGMWQVLPVQTSANRCRAAAGWRGCLAGDTDMCRDFDRDGSPLAWSLLALAACMVIGLRIAGLI